jgi:hypothetical protein
MGEVNVHDGDYVRCECCGRQTKVRLFDPGKIALLSPDAMGSMKRENVALKCQHCGYIICFSCASSQTGSVGIPTCPSCKKEGGPYFFTTQDQEGSGQEHIERTSPNGEHPESRGSDDETSRMLSDLNDPNPRIRAGNAILLGCRRVKAAVPQLLPLLYDDDVMVVGAAARALGEIGDKQAIPGLASALKRLSDFADVLQAARYGYAVSTGRIAYEMPEDREASREPLSDEERRIHNVLQRVAQETNVELQELGACVYAEIMTALAKFGDESAVAPIADLLCCPRDNPDSFAATSPALREDAAKALSELIRKLPATENTLNVLLGIERQLLSAVRQPLSDQEVEEIVDQLDRSNRLSPVEEDLQPCERHEIALLTTWRTLKRKRRWVSKALGRPTGSIWHRVLNWFRA